MPVVTYRYKQLKGLRVPIVTLAIQYGERWHPVEAYVDSGATYWVFTVQVADRLGLDYRAGRRLYVQVGDGSFIPVANLSLRPSLRPFDSPSSRSGDVLSLSKGQGSVRACGR